MRKFWFSSALAASAAAGVLLLGACKAQDGADAAQQAASSGSQAATAAPPAQQKPPAPQQPSDGVRRIGPAELQKMIEAGEAVPVDVRSKASFDQGHIKGSLSIPRDDLPSRLSELPKDKIAVFYCA